MKIPSMALLILFCLSPLLQAGTPDHLMWIAKDQLDPSEGGIPAKTAYGNQPTETTTDDAAEVVTNCMYISTDSDREFASHGSCGTLDKTGLLHFNKQALDKVDWSNFYGMECIQVKTNKEASSGWYFLTQEGLGRRTITADNGCLPFQKGLAVGWVDGKIAYYDRMMKIVHQTDYVWSSDFYTGYAQVCKRRGDRRDHLDCGYIDTDMKVIVETKYPMDKTPEPPKPMIKDAL